MDPKDVEILIQRLNAVAGVFQLGYLDVMRELSAVNGGPGPWLDEIEAEIVRSAKSVANDPAFDGYSWDEDAAFAITQSIRNRFIVIRKQLSLPTAGRPRGSNRRLP